MDADGCVSAGVRGRHGFTWQFQQLAEKKGPEDVSWGVLTPEILPVTLSESLTPQKQTLLPPAGRAGAVSSHSDYGVASYSLNPGVPPSPASSHLFLGKSLNQSLGVICQGGDPSPELWNPVFFFPLPRLIFRLFPSANLSPLSPYPSLLQTPFKSHLCGETSALSPHP